MRLQTILFPTESICGNEELYFHRRKDGIDFDGYFNLFYIEKRKKYSQLDGLKLVLWLRGVTSVCLMHDQTMLRQIQLDEPEMLCEYEFDLPYKDSSSGVFWFALKMECAEKVEVKGYFEGSISKMSPVSIAAVICTYKRETYVYRNLQCFDNVLKEKTLEVGTHLRLFVVDNGQTLEEHIPIQQLVQECGGQVSIFKNPNAGGAGGFTRGMLEALKRKKTEGLTHVLLMDDDAVFEPDLFVRLYGFLSTLKKEYSSITVGGNLMREDFPYLQHASGEWFKDFKVHNDHILMDLRDFNTCISDFMCCPDLKPQTYSGWWCCCFSLETVREDNLPIPLFLHYDDVEYGLRNRKNGIVFLNGIGAWHKGFELAFAGSTRYYDVRNTLITTALHQPEQSCFAVKKWVWRNIIGAILEFRYGEAYLAYQGLVDFCKGPDWLVSQNPEELNQEIRKGFVMEPLDKLRDQLSMEEYRNVCLRIASYEKDIGIDQIREFYAPYRRKGHFLKKVVWNGWFLPSSQKRQDELPIVAALETPYKVFRKREIILFEPLGKKALLAKRDYGKLKQILKCLVQTNILVDRFYRKAAVEYRERLNEITSVSAWEKYLGLEDYE